MWDLAWVTSCVPSAASQAHPGWSVVTKTTSIPVCCYQVTRLCHFVLDVDRESLALAHHWPVCGRETPALLFKWCANFFSLHCFVLVYFALQGHLPFPSPRVTWVKRFDFLKILNTDTYFYNFFSPNGSVVENEKHLFSLSPCCPVPF